MERLATEGKWDRGSGLPPYTAPAAAYNVAIPLGWWGGAPAFVAPDEIAREAIDGGTEGAEQCALLRDVFGNPFRPVSADPAWLSWGGGVVVDLAQAAYEERHPPGGNLDAVRLAVLADALEEAGCNDADILGHLRGPGPHVRGCFYLNLLLGKS
jgi:hypothetical protein